MTKRKFRGKPYSLASKQLSTEYLLIECGLHQIYVEKAVWDSLPEYNEPPTLLRKQGALERIFKAFLKAL